MKDIRDLLIVAAGMILLCLLIFLPRYISKLYVEHNQTLVQLIELTVQMNEVCMDNYDHPACQEFYHKK